MGNNDNSTNLTEVLSQFSESKKSCLMELIWKGC